MLKYIVLSLLIAMPFILQGQKSVLVSERPISDLKASNGSKLTLGSTASFGEGPLSFLLISKGSNKSDRWQKTYGGTSYDRATEIVETSDGGYFLLGSTSSYGEGNYDVLLIKIDGSGKQMWQKTFGEFHNEYAEGFIKDKDGNYIIKVRKQYCEEKNKFEDCTYGDQFLKIDDQGELIWEKNSITSM